MVGLMLIFGVIVSCMWFYIIFEIPIKKLHLYIKYLFERFVIYFDFYLFLCTQVLLFSVYYYYLIIYKLLQGYNYSIAVFDSRMETSEYAKNRASRRDRKKKDILLKQNEKSKKRICQSKYLTNEEKKEFLERNEKLKKEIKQLKTRG